MNIKEVCEDYTEMSYGIVGNLRSSCMYDDDNIMYLMKKRVHQWLIWKYFEKNIDWCVYKKVNDILFLFLYS